MHHTDFCKNCPHCYIGQCKLLANLPTGYLHTCIKHTKQFQELLPDSMQEFCVSSYPIPLLAFLGKTGPIPHVGNFAVTLTPGFASSTSGKLLKITEMDEDSIILTDKDCHLYFIRISQWYHKIFVLPDEILTENAKQMFI